MLFSLRKGEMDKGIKKYLIASSVLIGSCIGAGVLGIPYVAAQAGLLVTFFYILFVGLMIYVVNLYLGEICLRTKGHHQLIGYVEKYLGRKMRHVMEGAVVFGIYAALIAYMVGMGQSFSQMFTGSTDHYIFFGLGIGLLMSVLVYGGTSSLKRFEKYGVAIILILLLVIIGVFIGDVKSSNIFTFEASNVLLPFGVVLFALMSFQVIPELKIVLKGDEKYIKRVIRTGSIVSVLFYILFAFVVVGYKGIDTPQVATLALGHIFVFLGIFTMFTSYIASGVALRESFKYDERMKNSRAWFFAAIIPVVLFLFTQLTDFFSFTKILSIGGVVSGGLMAMVILLMIRKSKVKSSRKPEYSVPANWFVVGSLILLFLLGVVMQLI